MGIGNWRNYQRGGEGVGISLLTHLGYYLAIVAAPFPLFRVPKFLTPRIYALGLIYMTLANFGIVRLAFHFNNPNLPVNGTWLSLGVMTGIAGFAAGYALWCVPAPLRRSFYAPKTFKEHIATFTWNDKIHARGCLDFRETKDRDQIRAEIGVWCCDACLPRDKLIEFYRTKWPGWCRDPPVWFSAEFRNRVPRSLLVEVDESLWDERVEDEMGGDEEEGG